MSKGQGNISHLGQLLRPIADVSKKPSFGQCPCSLLKISLVLKAGAFLYAHNL
jgi:hypothetical protein